jgi:hypothetical protein
MMLSLDLIHLGVLTLYLSRIDSLRRILLWNSLTLCKNAFSLSIAVLPGNWHFVDKDFLEFFDVGAILICYFTTAHNFEINGCYDLLLKYKTNLKISIKHYVIQNIRPQRSKWNTTNYTTLKLCKIIKIYLSKTLTNVNGIIIICY